MFLRKILTVGAVALTGFSALAEDWVFDSSASTLTGQTSDIVLKATTDGSATSVKITGMSTTLSMVSLDLSGTILDTQNNLCTITTVGGLGSLTGYVNYLTEVFLPVGLTNISDNAFARNQSLTNVVPLLPDTVSYVGVNCFNRCPKLAGELRISNPDITALYGATFYNDSEGSLTKVDLRGCGAKSIAQGYFYAQKHITDVYLPEKVEVLYGNCFCKCTALTNVVPFLPATITQLPGEAFGDCSQLGGTLYLTNSLFTKLGNAFHNTAIREVVFAERGLEEIGSAFSYCTSLVSIRPSLPPTVKTITGNPFNRCYRLTNDLVFCNRELTGIVPFAMSYMDKGCAFKSVDFRGSSFTGFAGQVFYGCSGLETVWLPKGVQTFVINVFGNCTTLKNIYWWGTPPSQTDAFKYMGAPSELTCRMFIPRGKFNAAWEEWITANVETVAMTDAEKAAYRTKFTDKVGIPKRKVKVDTRYQYLCYWTPESGLSIIVR